SIFLSRSRVVLLLSIILLSPPLSTLFPYSTLFRSILHGDHADLHGDLAPLLVQLRQRLDELFHLLVAFVFFAEHVHQLSETLQGLTLAHQNLTAQQVQRLDTSGAFIQQSNTSITNDLLHAPLGDKAVTAVDL